MCVKGNEFHNDWQLNGTTVMQRSNYGKIYWGSGYIIEEGSCVLEMELIGNGKARASNCYLQIGMLLKEKWQQWK